MIKKITLLLTLMFPCAALAEYPKAIMVGDSIMSNVFDGGKVSDSAPWIISAERNVDIRNLSAPSNSLGSADFSGYNNPDIQTTYSIIGGAYSKFDYFIVQAGSNDWGRSINPDLTVEAARKIMSYSRYLNKKVLLVDAIYRGNEDVPNNIGLTLNYYRYMLYSVCRQENPDICRFANRQDFDGKNHPEYYTVSEAVPIHLNKAGHAAWARWVGAEFDKMRNGIFN